MSSPATCRTIQVSAQWALEGKQPDGEDYRILSCSNGELSRRDFAEALSRYQLGELSDLPQVSVSYPQSGASYVALALHWFAKPGQRLADGVEELDNQGRRTAYTSYFCLPYQPLADVALGYLAMYDALRDVTLTVTDGAPIEVPIAMPMSRTPAADDLAVHVAPLLFTGRPVCVLGAENTEPRERLQFIDTVMELLPYGLRARMTAATWTRATNRKHGFRLFFSSTPRTGEHDWEVNWDDDPTQIPEPGGPAGDYLDWLKDNIGPLVRLAGLTSELDFSTKDLLKAYEAVLRTQPRLQFRPRLPERFSKTGPKAPVPPPTPVADDPGERILHDCVNHVQLTNRNKLNTDISFLRRHAEGGVSAERCQRYRDLVNSLGLFRERFLLGDRSKYAEKLYDALLRLTTRSPLNYEDYCWVEKSAGIAPGDAPQQELLTAIARAGMTSPAVTAIVYWHLRQTEEKKLNKWLASEGVTAVQLFDRLSAPWKYPQHGQVLCEVALHYLRKSPGSYQALDIRSALQQHGFLARALQVLYSGDEQAQMSALRWFVMAAFPQASATPGRDLSPAAIAQILSGTRGLPPTPALLGAVLLQLRKQGSYELAWKTYARGSLTLTSLDQTTLAALRDRLPYIDAAEINAPETAAESGSGPIGLEHDEEGASDPADASAEGLVEVDVQWALHQRSAGSKDHHVIACSMGVLSQASFTDAISRFHLDELSDLPQVSVSYARLGGRSSGGYLALAIDDFAADGQRDAYDKEGSPIVYTSYFCLPYRLLADHAVSYQNLYEALGSVTLPETAGPMLQVTLARSAARPFTADPLAMRAAALLLTGRPVRVLGAEVTTIDDRLRFIDTVMDLLPYGLRARMTAATWMKAADVGYRLSFSSAARPDSRSGHVVTWGEPDRVPIPSGPPAEYLRWLEETLGAPARLAAATKEMRFDAQTGLQVLEIARYGRSPALAGGSISDEALQGP